MSDFKDDKIDPSVLKLQVLSNKVHVRNIVIILTVRILAEIYMMFNLEKFGVFGTSLVEMCGNLLLAPSLIGIYFNEKKREKQKEKEKNEDALE